MVCGGSLGGLSTVMDRHGSAGQSWLALSGRCALESGAFRQSRIVKVGLVKYCRGSAVLVRHGTMWSGV